VDTTVVGISDALITGLSELTETFLPLQVQRAPARPTPPMRLCPQSLPPNVRWDDPDSTSRLACQSSQKRFCHYRPFSLQIRFSSFSPLVVVESLWCPLKQKVQRAPARPTPPMRLCPQSLPPIVRWDDPDHRNVSATTVHSAYKSDFRHFHLW
jgi:hypothetical protein